MIRARIALLAGAAALAITVIPIAAVAAPAHNVVIATSPAADATLTELPESFSVTTNEPMLALDESQGFVLQIRDAAGAYFGDGCVAVSDATMSAEPALGAAGAYTMLWQAVSADGHTIDGEVPFTWQPPAGFEPAAALTAPPVCGVATPSPSPTASNPATPEPQPTTQPDEPASAIDLTTVLWIGGIVLAVGIAVAVGIALAARRRP